MLDALFRILALTRKELLAVLKDPRSRVTLLVPPILQSLLFGYAATYDLNHVPYAVLDQDRGAAAHELIARLDGSGVFQFRCECRVCSRTGELIPGKYISGVRRRSGDHGRDLF